MLCNLTRHQVRQLSISSCRMRRKPKPERDQSKRNLQGEELIERLRRRENDLARQKVSIVTFLIQGLINETFA